MDHSGQRTNDTATDNTRPANIFYNNNNNKIKMRITSNF